MTKELMFRGENFTVSDDGKVWWNGKERKQSLTKDGYKRVSFQTKETNSGWSTVVVSKLVALAFIPNPNNLPEVDHIDFNRQNNNVKNLAWISRTDNVRRSLINKPDVRGINNPNFGNKKLSKFYKEHPDIAKEKQGRLGKKNGRYIHGKYVSEKV